MSLDKCIDCSKEKGAAAGLATIPTTATTPINHCHHKYMVRSASDMLA